MRISEKQISKKILLFIEKKTTHKNQLRKKEF